MKASYFLWVCSYVLVFFVAACGSYTVLPFGGGMHEAARLPTYSSSN
jgi:hypothetical protein